MTNYKCNQCGKVEERTIGGSWELECSSCAGMLKVELTGDYCVCRCGLEYEGHIRQCKCSNTFLAYSYADEPGVNEGVIANIRKNVASQNSTRYCCKECGKEESFFTAKPMASFCSSCGSRMEKANVDLKKLRLSKRWSQALMASELDISKRYYRELELKQRKPSSKLRLKICGL